MFRGSAEMGRLRVSVHGTCGHCQWVCVYLGSVYHVLWLIIVDGAVV